MTENPAPNDANKWLALVQLLHRGLKELPACEWFPNISGGADFHAKIDALRRIEGRHTDILDAAARRWCQTETWPGEMPDEAIYILKQRTFVAFFYSRANVIEGMDTPSTIVPFPKQGVPQVAEWYLTHWWDFRGIHLLAEGET